ncbi:MAG: TolC family protein [Clostridiales Family XIII bacterium]|jgi:hypothetical protein|nr:TolC family protein [Clostridiales Family XIII bacterium]
MSMMSRTGSRIFIAGLSVIMLIGLMPLAQPDYAEAASLTPFPLASAERMALASSSEISKVYSQILLKKINYTDSVTSINAKMKNKRTFRWSPLLKFKFPEKFNMSDEFEMNIKPQSLSSEIVILQHQMNDLQYDVILKARDAYFKVYTAQEKSAFIQQMLTDAQTELARNKARLIAGQANQSDIDKIEKNIDKLTGDLAQQLRTFQSAKSDLSDLVKVNVTTGYRFLNPLKDADLTRSQLNGIIDHTLGADQGVYEARSAESLALVNLNLAESLMRGKYGGKMTRLNAFISGARSGADVDYAAFQVQYKAMLKDIDSKWQGNWRILFIKIPKDFLKGQIDGIRYIEDEPYALYTACMEYAAAVKDRNSAEKDLRKQIEGDFEALVTARNASVALATSVKDSKKDLERLQILNRVGKADFDEVKDKQADYQDLQMDAFDVLTTYNELLVSFDELCCGAVTQYFNGKNFNTDSGGGAVSFPTKDGQIWYSIYGDVAELTFVFGIDVPDDFEPEVTHYELWYDDTKISGHEDASKSFTHLTLDYGDSNMLKVRLFDGDKFVAECQIDTSEPRGPLPIAKTPEASEPDESVIGTYQIETKVIGPVNTSVMTPTFNSDLEVAAYSLSYKGQNIGEEASTPAGQGFNYLALLAADITEVELTAYDNKGDKICTGYFDSTDGSIRTRDKLPE